MKDDGGPAFPVIGAPGAPEDYPGMTLRQWYAGMALQGLLASTEYDGQTNQWIAVMSFQFADRMIEAEQDTHLGRVLKLIRAEILEEAARTCLGEQVSEPTTTSDDAAYNSACIHCAAAIRALKAKP